MSPFKETTEQAAVCDSLAAGRSVVVDAVAGSGKTTTIFALCARVPEARVLQVTYNTALRLEVRNKAEKHRLYNLEVHTYHSLARAYYDPTTATDIGIEASVDMPPRDLPAFDIVIVDECQDATPLLYRFVRKVVSDLRVAPTLGLFGDNMQTVYQFKRADPRYLTLAARIWPEFRFTPHKLTTSFRLTREMAGFVNDSLLGFHKVTAPRPGSRVHYMVYDSSPAHDLVQMVFALFERGLRPSDFFVLAPSLAMNTGPMVALENALVMHNIPVHVPNQEDRNLDDDVMRNKVVFSTFHQSKGRERAVAIVLGLDGAFARTFARDAPETECPTTAYVACTRASQQLVVAQAAFRGRARFLRPLRPEAVEVTGGEPELEACGGAPTASDGSDGSDGPDARVVYRERRTSATKLVRHLTHELVSELGPMVAAIVSRTADAAWDATDVPSKVATGSGSFEDVTELNAFAFSALWETLSGCAATTMHDRVDDVHARLPPFARDQAKAVPRPCRDIADCLRLANLFRAAETRQIFKLKQLSAFDWIAPELAERVAGVYRDTVQGAQEFEAPVAVANHRAGGCLITVTGVLDILTPTQAVEIKCTQTLGLEHFLQAIIYRWMWTKTLQPSRGDREFVLLNVLTGERWRVDGDAPAVEAVVNRLLAARYEAAAPEDDDAFTRRCLASSRV